MRPFQDNKTILRSRTSGLHSSLSELVPRSVFGFLYVRGWRQGVEPLERNGAPGYGDCWGPDLGEMMQRTAWWARTWPLGRKLVAKVDAVVEGHEEGVGISTTRVSNKFEPYRSRRLHFPNYSRPIILFSKMEHSVTRWEDVRAHVEDVILEKNRNG
jgi:hypothetical protein